MLCHALASNNEITIYSQNTVTISTTTESNNQFMISISYNIIGCTDYTTISPNINEYYLGNSQ